MSKLLKDDERPSFIRTPLTYVKWWSSEKNPTNLSGFGIALASGLIAGALLTFAGSALIKQFGPTGNVPGYVALIIAGVCLTGGLSVAWGLTRQFYEVVLDKEQSEENALRAELELTQRKLADLEPSREMLQSVRTYTEHVYGVAGTLIGRQVSFRDLDSDDVKRSICGLAQTHLNKATGKTFRVSIWSEATAQGGIFDRLQGAAARVAPDSVGEAIAPTKSRFRILAAPDHTPNEIESFEVRVEPSWLKHEQLQEEDGTEDRVYKADTEQLEIFRGGDIEAFVKHGYRSVRAIAFRRHEQIAYLLLLSTSENAFTQVEELYLLWLKRILELDVVVTHTDGSDAALLPR